MKWQGTIAEYADSFPTWKNIRFDVALQKYFKRNKLRRDYMFFFTPPVKQNI